MHDDIQAGAAEVRPHSLRQPLDTEVTHILVTLVLADFGRRICQGIECRVEWIDPLELQLPAIRQRHRLVHFAALEQLGKDSQCRWPATKADRCSCLGQGLGYGKAKATVIGDSGDEGTLSGQVDWQHSEGPCSIVVAGM